MNKTIYRIMGIIVAFTLALGGFTKVQATSTLPATTGKPVYAYYYLWWSTQHWKDKLGSNYPYTASPLPLPATTDADGCHAVSTRRLSEAFAASVRVGGFRNWVSYKAASSPSADYIINDMNFLYKEFQNETAWERIDGKPVVTFTGSRKYSDADLLKISNAVRDRMFLVGDETRTTLTTTRIAMFDAVTYYWSSQDPYGNPASFDQIKEMGDKVHAAGKRWYAPLNPGFNTALLTGATACIHVGMAIRFVCCGTATRIPIRTAGASSVHQLE